MSEQPPNTITSDLAALKIQLSEEINKQRELTKKVEEEKKCKFLINPYLILAVDEQLESLNAEKAKWNLMRADIEK